jgi:hypothetical protein
MLGPTAIDQGINLQRRRAATTAASMLTVIIVSTTSLGWSAKQDRRRPAAAH